MNRSYKIGNISVLHDLDHKERIDHTDHLSEVSSFLLETLGK